ncbi:MAG TPA: tetratricopeptide repeat protein [Flavisolibacter sp.]|nr:tetratricopeptide repeat protein [Flavisolibacter sp.]
MKPACLLFLLIPAACFIISCTGKANAPSPALVKELSLKKGAPISCGPADQQLGTVVFKITGSESANNSFRLGLKLLHSFEYDEAEKVFADIIDKEPECIMAYWGVAMSSFHALWAPPSEPELKKGSGAVSIARSLARAGSREGDYVEAIAAFYTGWDSIGHRDRCIRFEKAMEALHTRYPDDKEAAIFYALALNAAADPADRSFYKQKKAGNILDAIYPGEPDHPGIVHYIIHTYDLPELATMALPAARKYASIAPSSAHALHMPSHIFTRLGLWDECISSNLASMTSAQCYAQQAGIQGHWDEELHAMDYLMYAYLQKGDNDLARKQLDYLRTIGAVHPANFKVAYAFASVPSRYVLENKSWKEAAALQLHAASFDWKEFPWQKAIFQFARLMGAVHTGNTAAAKTELKELKLLHQALLEQKDAYKAAQVEIQINTSEAWIKLKNNQVEEALALMKMAANQEDRTEKHPVTPAEVIPARELLGDMLLEARLYNEALGAYEANLRKHPNRFNGLYGAGLAAEKAGDLQKATVYYKTLLRISGHGTNARPEIQYIKRFLKES